MGIEVARGVGDILWTGAGLALLALGWAALWRATGRRPHFALSLTLFTAVVAAVHLRDWVDISLADVAKWIALAATGTVLGHLLIARAKPPRPEPAPEPPPPPDSPVWASERWDELARRRRIYLAAHGGPLLAALIFFILDRFVLHLPRVPGGLAASRPWLLPAAIALGVVWAIVAGVAWYRFARWPCPRCARPFQLSRGGHLFLHARACGSCGLPNPRVTPLG